LNAHNLQLSDLFIKISGFESDLDKLDLFLSSQNKKSDKFKELEKIIEEIIEKLNGINQILRNKNILNVNEDGVSDLNLLKEKYTMQSERDIHDQILNKEKELGIKSKKEEEDHGKI
jgi:broad specificity polyphosphatase/5'/3'-nucleotidase SurE